jgi:hypothetical protein
MYSTYLSQAFPCSITGATQKQVDEIVKLLMEAKTSFALTQDEENKLWLSQASEDKLIEYWTQKEKEE